ncbi:hypothetical protein QFZ80_002748 [Paenibacillus sp. V4I7]|nr:hypothetical protein [Paenibacillus sp. V4I7]MDQ0915095.1 hypothetical protein [Paenibacillus sp. V4I5]
MRSRVTAASFCMLLNANDLQMTCKAELAVTNSELISRKGKKGIDNDWN